MVTNLRFDDWQALHQQLRGIAKRRALLDVEEAQCLREAERTKLWLQLGCIHMGEYMERELGYGPQVGLERLRVARELAALPHIEAALGEGVLPFSAVRELTRIATAATEVEWVDAARGKTMREIEPLVSGRKRGDRPGDPKNRDLVKRVVRLELMPAVFALFRQVRSAMADEQGGQLDDNSLLEILCRRALDGGGSSERPAHQIAFTVCESCGRGWQSGAGREIEVPPEVVERARCDAEWIGSLEDPDPARVTATVTRRIRRQVLARDHHACTVPGCRSARNLDLHHIEYQRDGGGHELWNMTTCCSGHHQQLHEGALTIRGKAPNALEFTWREQPGDLQPPAATVAVKRAGSHGGADVSSREEPAGSAAVHLVVKADGREIDAPATTVYVAVEQARVHVDAEASADGAAVHVVADDVDRDAIEALPTTRCEVGRVPVERAGSLGGGDVRWREAPTGDDVGMDADAIDRDAVAALTTAGYQASAARSAVKRARSHVGARATAEQLIREALRCCSTPSTVFRARERSS